MPDQEFLLPDLGEGLTEGEIVRWLVTVGDTVAVDQPVVEVETAKAVVEVPSPFAGTVTRLHAEEGQEVQVGQPLLTVDVGAAPGAPPTEAEAADMVPEPQEAPGDTSAEAPSEAQGETSGEAPSEGPDETSGDGASGSVLVGYGTAGGARSRRRRGGNGAASPPTHPAGNGAPGPVTGDRPLAKPPVRKMAKDLGVDLRDVAPSGPEGTVTRDDIERFLAGRGQAGGQERRIPLTGVRRRIAEKMTISRREIPDATTWVDCDATALMALRDELNDSQDEVKVSALAIVLRAAVAGLARFPELNASLDTEAQQIVVHPVVHLGVAAQTDRGLVVPVIRDAQSRTTLELAAELIRLAVGAREGSLAPGELTGGTFTVSNYGSFGVDGGSAVINHPEAAILGVGRISPKPWVHDGELAVRQVVQLSISFDHRICDGGEAAGFLRFVADCVERPGVLLGAL